MHRYIAPEHTTAVFTSDGEKRVNRNHEIHLDDDAPQHVHLALRSAGCTLASADAPVTEKAAPKRTGRKSRAKSKAPKPAAAAAAPEASAT